VFSTVMCGLGCSGSGQGAVEGPCEHGNEILGSIMCWEVLEQLHTGIFSRRACSSMWLVY
jgi:hypothetical protein